MHSKNLLVLICIVLLFICILVFNNELLILFLIFLASSSYIIQYLYTKKFKVDYCKYKKYKYISQNKLSWIITEYDKRTYRKLKRKNSKYILFKLFTFYACFFFILGSISFIAWLNIFNSLLSYILLTLAFFLLFFVYLYLVNNNPIVITLSIPIISILLLWYIKSILEIELSQNSILGIFLFIVINITIFSFNTLFLFTPDSIRKLSQNFFLYNGITNIFLLFGIFFIQKVFNNFKFLNISTTEKISKELPSWTIKLIRNEQIQNEVNELIEILVIDHFIGLLTFYGLITFIVFYLSELILKYKNHLNKVKAEIIFRDILKDTYFKKISYDKLVNISYYGGEEYDQKLLQSKELHEIIVKNEKKIYNTLPIYRSK